MDKIQRKKVPKLQFFVNRKTKGHCTIFEIRRSKMTPKFLELKNNREIHCIQNWRETHNVKKFNKIRSWNKSSHTWIRFRGCCCKKARTATPLKNRILSAAVAAKVPGAQIQSKIESFPRLLLIKYLKRKPNCGKNCFRACYYQEGRFRKPFGRPW